MARNIIRLEMSKEVARRIKAIQKLTGAKDRAEVFSYALTLLAWAIEEVADGKLICSIDHRTKILKELHLGNLFDRIRENTKTEREKIIGKFIDIVSRNGGEAVLLEVIEGLQESS